MPTSKAAPAPASKGSLARRSTEGAYACVRPPYRCKISLKALRKQTGVDAECPDHARSILILIKRARDRPLYGVIVHTAEITTGSENFDEGDMADSNCVCRSILRSCCGKRSRPRAGRARNQPRPGSWPGV